MNGLTPLLGRLEDQKTWFVNIFACEKFPTCEVKVQIALKFSKLSIFLKFPRVSKILFDV